MTMKFCSFASGSSGNCYFVTTENTNILIDVGIAGKKVLEGLEAKNLEPADLDGILITHEHIDHMRSLRMIGKKAINAKVYTSSGTMEQIEDKLPENRAVKLQNVEDFYIGDILVKPFHVSHDTVEPIGYSLEHEGRQVSIVTDTGYITDEIFNNIRDANLLVIEANHEVNILKMGSYTYTLKRRILGEQGHLSNETAGKCICNFLNYQKDSGDGDVPKIILAHLSKENNTPKQAYLTIKNILFEEDYYIDKDIDLDIAPRDEASEFTEV